MFGRLPAGRFFDMSQNRETRTASNPALLAVGQRRDVMAWKQPTGVFRAYDNPAQVVKVGTPGQSDAMMVVAVTITQEMVGKTVGVAVAAEFKTATGRQRDNQAAWLAYALTRPKASIRLDAKWLEREYPGSFAILRHKLREAYKSAK